MNQGCVRQFFPVGITPLNCCSSWILADSRSYPPVRQTRKDSSRERTQLVHRGCNARKIVPRPNATNVAAVGRDDAEGFSCPACPRAASGIATFASSRSSHLSASFTSAFLSSYLFLQARVQLCLLFRQITLPAGVLLFELLFLDRLRLLVGLQLIKPPALNRRDKMEKSRIY